MNSAKDIVRLMLPEILRMQQKSAIEELRQRMERVKVEQLVEDRKAAKSDG